MSGDNRLFEDLAERLYQGDSKAVVALIEQGLALGVSPKKLLEQGLIAGMATVGEDFKCGELFVPEIIVAARAMHAGIDLLRPLMADVHTSLSRTVILGTVKGDLHDIGKKLVGVMMEGAGYEVIDLGHDVDPEAFVDAVKKHQADLVGLSALLSTTMPMMKTTIDALATAGLRKSVWVLVGGAPVTSDWAQEIGADGYANDAVRAVDRARRLFAESNPRD